MKHLKVAASVFFSMTVFAAVAAAQQAPVPAGCTTEDLPQAFHTGEAQGRSIVNMAWNSVNRGGRGCARVDEFAEIIRNNIHDLRVPPGSGQFLVCRFAGLGTGARDRVVEVTNECVNECCQSGQAAARINAELYCSLSIAIGGLSLDLFLTRRPVRTCGFSFQGCCGGEFINSTENFGGGVCRPYTQEPYTPVWRQWEYNGCAYEAR